MFAGNCRWTIDVAPPHGDMRMIWWPDNPTNEAADSHKPVDIPVCSPDISPHVQPDNQARPRDIIGVLIDRLLTGTGPQRKQAAIDLGGMGPAAWEAYMALLAALKDENPDVRWAVGQALVRVPWKGHPPLILTQALDDRDPMQRVWAVSALGGMCEAPEWIVGEAMRLMTDPDWFVRVAAADAFMRLVQSPERAHDLLGRTFVTDSDRLTAAEAIWEAWSCSPRGARAATELLLRINRPGSEAIALARKILGRLRAR